MLLEWIIRCFGRVFAVTLTGEMLLFLQKIQRIHMIGELTKGACSMFGANSSATPDGSLLQLRALDWDVDGQILHYPEKLISTKDFLQDHSRTSLRSQSTILSLEMDIHLLILGGLVG